MPEKARCSELHTNHRHKMMLRFAKDMSLDNFREHEIMEMLLYFCYARCDTNEIGHRLVNTFGSVEKTLYAKQEDLEKSGIIGENPAGKLKFISMLFDHLTYGSIMLSNDEKLDRDRLKKFALDSLGNQEKPMVLLFCTDQTGRLCRKCLLGVGDFDDIMKDGAAVIRRELVNSGTSSFYLAHNHPGRGAEPSRRDVFITKDLAVELAKFGYTLKDHFIVSSSYVTSLRESGYIANEFIG